MKVKPLEQLTNEELEALITERNAEVSYQLHYIESQLRVLKKLIKSLIKLEEKRDDN